MIAFITKIPFYNGSYQRSLNIVIKAQVLIFCDKNSSLNFIKHIKKHKWLNFLYCYGKMHKNSKYTQFRNYIIKMIELNITYYITLSFKAVKHNKLPSLSCGSSEKQLRCRKNISKIIFVVNFSLLIKTFKGLLNILFFPKCLYFFLYTYITFFYFLIF